MKLNRSSITRTPECPVRQGRKEAISPKAFGAGFRSKRNHVGKGATAVSPWNSTNILIVVILVVIGIIAARGLLSGGYVPTHDNEYHIIRLWQFDKVFGLTSLFPRWAPDLNNGYGVPLFTFFYPLPNYVGELFHVAGFSFVDSVQLVLAFGHILSGLTFYFWACCFFKRKQAVLASLFYILAPYHLVDTMIRGSVGEVWALVLVPIVLYSTTNVLQKKRTIKPNYIVLTAISSALLLLSHNSLGLAFFVFTFIYAIALSFYWNTTSKLKYVVISLLTGLLMTSFFYLPILVEKQYVTGLDILSYKDHFPEVFQLIFPSWGSGFSGSGIGDQMSFQIGIAHALVLLFAFFLAYKQRNKFIGFLSVFVIVVITLMLEQSSPVWELFVFMKYFQYPWRLLAFVILVTSFLTGYVSSSKPRITIPLLALLCVLLYAPYTRSVVYEKRSDDFYLSNSTWTDGTATISNTFNTRWFTDKPQPPYEEKIEVVNGNAVISSLQEDNYSVTFDADAKERSEIIVNIAYYPGWRVYINGEKQNIKDNPVIRFTIPKGRYTILVQYGQTKLQFIGALVSFASLVFLIIYYGNKKNKKKTKDKRRNTC